MLVVCSCGQRMDVADRLAGKWVRCPRCRAKMKVPAIGDADLPIALDRPPDENDLQPQGARWDSAAREPTEENPAELVLGDLAAAVSEANGQALRRPSRPASASELPLALSKPPSPSRPGRPGVAVAQLADDEAPPEKKRDLLPFIITGVAAAIFLAVLVGIIVLKSGDASSPEHNEPTATAEARQAVTAPASTNANYEPGSYGFFGHVPANRTSKDYLEEKEKKQNTP